MAAYGRAGAGSFPAFRRFSMLFPRSIVLTLLLALVPAAASAWPASIISVHDGDTVTVAPCGDTSTPIVIRLYGIDAPETKQKGGLDSTTLLRRLLPEGSSVELIPQDVDRYGRTVAIIMADGSCINARMVEAGQAWVYSRYCRAKTCKNWQKLQKQAQQKRAGLWEEKDPTPPWKWRKEK